MTDHRQLFDAIDETRRRAGFLTLAETLALAETGTVVYDPFSTLISRRAVIGERNVFHPNVRVECHDAAVLRIGSGNVFHSNTVIEAAMNSVVIGDDNLFGEGAVYLKANAPEAAVEIGDNGRYCGIVNVYGKSALGSGSQVLGNITVQDCSLAAGQPHTHPTADERGAVLKGAGIARRIQLARGQVIDGWGRFRAEDAVAQSTFHPAKSAAKA